jgi:aryl-alcohol dehydrogenase-like predicted oxidoreductase
MPAANGLRVVLGLMVVGPEDSPGARLKGVDNCTKAFDIFQERGYNEIDTARLYLGGKQEAFTREAKWKERNLKVATKAYPITPGLHEADVLAATLETSLAELGTDCVDVSLHSHPMLSISRYLLTQEFQIFYLHAPVRLLYLLINLTSRDIPFFSTSGRLTSSQQLPGPFRPLRKDP